VYVGAGRLVDSRVIAMARERHLLLVVAWQPDDRSATLARVADGAYDRSLRRLVRQLRGLEPKAILRPMPEPNTPWYAWSGAVGKQGAARYVRAWRHVYRLVKSTSGGRTRLMWTPYARSLPDEAGNRIRDFFPGRDLVDAVGAVAYNFGSTGVLDWTDPQPLFASAYAAIDRLARKPFWIAETGSTGLGGSTTDWIGRLGAIRQAMPRLRGVLWYDVREPNGDFRITQTPATTAAFSSYVARAACR
jgi:beta-mannanase